MGRRKGERGSLILIGGNEAKTGERAILSAVSRKSLPGPAVICTAASDEPDQVWSVYEKVFRELGLREISHLRLTRRQHAEDAAAAAKVTRAKLVFLSGGDQVNITSRIGGTVVFDALRHVYESGGVIAGTSAGASALGQTMPVSHPGHEHNVSASFYLVQGLGLFPNVIIDQHFGQRGRMVRLIGAVAENSRLLGIGIDEDTAVVLCPAGEFEVLGAGAVYVVDGKSVTYNNVQTGNADRPVSVFDLRVHVLSSGDRFDVASRRPVESDSCRPEPVTP
jgi:cyanophycinase